MKRVILILSTVLVMISLSFISSAVKASNPTSEIRYVAEAKVDIYREDAFNCKILSHEFDATTGQGVIRFDGRLTKITDTAFMECDLKSLKLPDSLSEVSANALSHVYASSFEGKHAVDNGKCIVIDNILIRFVVGYKHDEYTIPDGITEIYSSAFLFAELKSLTIPASVNKIGSCAFVCGTGKLIMMSATPPTIVGGELSSEWGVDRPTFSIDVYVSKGAAERYKRAPHWNKISEYIHEM